MKKTTITIADGTVVPVEIRLGDGDIWRWYADEKYLPEISWKLNSLGRSAVVERDPRGIRCVRVWY